MKLNIGEWSEGYVFLKLLGEGKVHAKKSNENKLDPSLYLDVLAVICRELDTFIKYTHSSSTVKCIFGDTMFAEYPARVFLNKSVALFQAIKEKPLGTIAVPEIESFFSDIKHFTVKGSSREFPEHPAFGGKTDIVLEVQSITSGIHEEIGFSIKSYAGSPPTLFNASAASCIIYDIEGLSNLEAEKIKFIVSRSGHPDVIGRIAYITEKGGTLKYRSSYNCTPTGSNFKGEAGPLFSWNLELLDSQMPRLISEMLLIRYGYKGNCSKPACDSIVSEMIILNPMDVRNPGVYYPTKIKNFVYASFGKMTAASEWDGTYKINGGYIEVSKNGDVFFIRANSDDQFMTYLLTHTKIDSPSTAPDRHNHHGEIFYDELSGRYSIGLNFQIRFNS